MTPIDALKSKNARITSYLSKGIALKLNLTGINTSTDLIQGLSASFKVKFVRHVNHACGTLLSLMSLKLSFGVGNICSTSSAVYSPH